ncbi:hypothetical protein [Sporomusa sp.]|uniref:hypothetical protein n=1 Tax=Sporomusa sp. TaxID=2078658 RepID=UPI002D80D525|nr:hypothetical protein [Sporomusa sp.]
MPIWNHRIILEEPDSSCTRYTHRMPIVLTVAVCNDKAVNMYEKFGFVPVSEEMGELENRGRYKLMINMAAKGGLFRCEK